MTTTVTIAPSLQSVYAALNSFLQTVTGLPSSNVVQGLPNRAAMPKPGFVCFQALTRRRLRTNIDTMVEINDALPTQQTMEEGFELPIQIDCYGPVSCDWANMLSATLRDAYGVNQLGPLGLTPLYADEARMIPLVDGEEQYEERWSLDARFQVNAVTTVTQQYADALELELINVDERFPVSDFVTDSSGNYVTDSQGNRISSS